MMSHSPCQISDKLIAYVTISSCLSYIVFKERLWILDNDYLTHLQSSPIADYEAIMKSITCKNENNLPIYLRWLRWRSPFSLTTAWMIHELFWLNVGRQFSGIHLLNYISSLSASNMRRLYDYRIMVKCRLIRQVRKNTYFYIHCSQWNLKK